MRVRRWLQMSAEELHARRAELYERLSAQQPRDVVDRLRLAVLALDSDNPQPVSVVVAAAADALRLGDLSLSERLGAAVLKRDPDLDARLTLAQALAWQGRGREADDVLAAVDPATLSDAELMAWALPRAANQFWMLSQPERATAFLQTTRNRVTSPVARTTVDALSATFAMNAGRPGRAMELAEEVLASPDADDTAVGWSAAAAALSCARMGRFAEVDALAERAMEAQHPGLLRFTSGFGQTTALMMAGELDRAQELAQQLTDYAQMQQPGRAIGEVLVADVLIARGDSADAATLLRGAAEALAPTGYSWGPLAWMLLAQALGLQGEMGEAAKALSRAESRHGLEVHAVRPGAAVGQGVDDGGAQGSDRCAIGRARRGTDCRARRSVGGRGARIPRRGAARRYPRGRRDRPAHRRCRLCGRRSGVAARPRVRGQRCGCIEGGIGRVRRHRHDGLGRRRRQAGGRRPLDPRIRRSSTDTRVAACWNARSRIQATRTVRSTRMFSRNLVSWLTTTNAPR